MGQQKREEVHGVLKKRRRREIMQLEDWINTTHRESLNVETAYAYDSRLPRRHKEFLLTHPLYKSP